MLPHGLQTLGGDGLPSAPSLSHNSNRQGGGRTPDLLNAIHINYGEALRSTSPEMGIPSLCQRFSGFITPMQRPDAAPTTADCARLRVGSFRLPQSLDFGFQVIDRLNLTLPWHKGRHA